MSRVLGSNCQLLVLALASIFCLMGCKSDPIQPDAEEDPANYANVTVFPDGADFGEFFPAHTKGDCSFESVWGSHGPKVNVEADLHIDASKTQLWLSCSMVASETESDWTEAEGSWDTLLYTAPTGWYISEISSAASASWEYTDKDIFWDKTETSMCNLDVMGNTLLNDVCNTLIDGDATRMKIHLHPISVVLCDRKR